MSQPGTPDAFSANADAIIAMLRRRKILWELKLGTVLDSGTIITKTRGMPLQLDGDATQQNASSLIGWVNQGSRVVVLCVPPNGYYIIGYVGNVGHFPTFTENGQISVSFTSQTSFTQVVTFAKPFSLPPRISVNIASGAGATAQWGVRGISPSATGFTVFGFTPNAAVTWSNIPVQWTADEQT